MGSIVLFYAERKGYKLVGCNRCPDQVGWLSNEQIAIAAKITAERGGVMCPSCREKVCKRCFGFHKTEREKENCRFLGKCEDAASFGISLVKKDQSAGEALLV